VEFSDVHATVGTEEVDALLNADDYQRNGNFCSVREYYRIMSNRKLDYSNIVVGPIRLNHTKKYYERTSIVPEAFNLAMDELEASGIDLARFDSLGEGVIDALNFMYAGGTVYGVNGNNNNPSELWPHNSIRIMRHRGYRTYFYMLSSMGRRAVDLNIGTFCHETGHLLCRFPDLYDYGRRDGDSIKSRGIGRYCLMGGGNHLNRGRTPSPVCAYLRGLVDWTDNVVLINGLRSCEARHGDYGTLMKYRTDLANEYFLIENRSRVGLDQHLPSSGLAVYHCDINGSNEWQAGTAARHYQVALLQADGRLDLEENLPSDNTDLFGRVEGVALAHNTPPSSRMWDGSDSGLTVSDIGPPEEVIRFRLGDSGPHKNVVKKEIVTHLLIPDNDPEGVRSSAVIEELGKITEISVSIDITHTYIGDLEVSVESPSGTRVVIHDREGFGPDDIQATYKSDNTRLDILEGEEIFGSWILWVRDLEGRDVGRLNRWELEITFETSDESVRGEARPNLSIPDATSGGVSSTIPIAAEGVLKEISVYVEIDHTFIGDLHVELISPTEQSAVLHNQTGGSQDDLRLTFDRTSAPALDILIGESIRGDWALRVRDLERADKGSLIRWSLDLRYTR
jgi:M6 family metalloprotease-like protein